MECMSVCMYLCMYVSIYLSIYGARCSSVVKHSFVVRWVIGSIFREGTIELFLVPPSALNWCNKGCGMSYPVYGMMYL